MGSVVDLVVGIAAGVEVVENEHVQKAAKASAKLAWRALKTPVRALAHKKKKKK